MNPLDVRSFTFWEIFYRTFDFAMKNIRKIFNVMLVPVALQVVGIMLALLPVSYVTDLGYKGAQLVPYLLFILLSLALGIVLICIGFWKSLLVTVYLVRGMNDYLDDKEINFEAYKNEFLSRHGAYIKMLLWCTLFYIAAFVIGVMVAFLAGALIGLLKVALFSHMPDWIYIILGTLIGIAVFGWFGVKVLPTTAIFALEYEIKPLDTIKRSFVLTKGSFWFIFAVIIVVFLINVVFCASFGLVTFFMKSAANTEVVRTAFTILENCAPYVLMPIHCAVITIVYKKLLLR